LIVSPFQIRLGKFGGTETDTANFPQNPKSKIQNGMSEPNLTPQVDSPAQVSSTPLRCVTGAVMSGGMGYGLSLIMIAIATNFANRPVHSSNPLVINITSAVRTLVVGVFALGTGIFGIVAIGLLALAVQLLVQQWKKPKILTNDK
jgi:Protein of unknown function (DUF3082)